MLDFSSVQSLDQLGHQGDMMDNSTEILFISAGGHCKFWHGQGCSLCDVVHPAFPLLTMASPIFQGTLKNGFGEVVAVCEQLPEQALNGPQGS